MRCSHTSPPAMIAHNEHGAGQMDIETVTEKVEKVSEGYAAAFGIDRDATWFMLKLQEEVGELTQSFLRLTGQARTKGKTGGSWPPIFGAAIADVFVPDPAVGASSRRGPDG